MEDVHPVSGAYCTKEMSVIYKNQGALDFYGSISLHVGLLVVSAQKWALGTGMTIIEKTIRQYSRETALLNLQRE